MKKFILVFCVLLSTAYTTEELNQFLEARGSLIHWGKEGQDSKYRLLFFHDKKAREFTTNWFKKNIEELLSYGKIPHIHFLFPGGISFLTPRRKVYSRIRSEIEKIRIDIEGVQTQEVRHLYQDLSVKWFVDDKRSLTSHFKMPRHKLGAVLVDEKNQVLKSFPEIEDLLRYLKNEPTEVKKVKQPEQSSKP